MGNPQKELYSLLEGKEASGTRRRNHFLSVGQFMIHESVLLASDPKITSGLGLKRVALQPTLTHTHTYSRSSPVVLSVCRYLVSAINTSKLMTFH